MQQDRQIAELKRVVEKAAEANDGAEPFPLGLVAEHVAKAFHVRDDEVAILALVKENRFLSFLYPERLRTVGSIPLTSTSALAARTARDKKAEIMNNFALVRHATVFEGVPLGRGEGEFIQKIMSAPILAGGKLLGVIQVSRKGRSAVESGPDFSAQELKSLVAMTSLIGEFLLRYHPPSEK